ncbi:hypothetical protein V2K50_11300 [Pseudomonas alliivorans]|uniref:hypothetical protein n=1 Tax=Pseudomonas alliivorans TaxID=2810613 RepID=UPI0020911945|nr:hypothetical protein [Pseudomonas alliivorans]MCO5364788.1 hypothetical protein [Pseudomonas alliivorans]MEE5120429.1 hypothetical protein [Pseudomonas alliivorans]
MNHQFKPGDLALVVGSSEGVSPNIGMAVELVEHLITNDEFNLPDGRRLVNRGPACWVITAAGLLACRHHGGWIDVGGIALVMQQYLIPLRGDFAPEQQKAKEAHPA